MRTETHCIKLLKLFYYTIAMKKKTICALKNYCSKACNEKIAVKALSNGKFHDAMIVMILIANFQTCSIFEFRGSKLIQDRNFQ